MVRNDAITTAIQEPVRSRSTLTTRETSLKASTDTAQQIVQNWIEAASGGTFVSSFIDSIYDGVALCRLVNRIEPNRIRDVVENPNEDESQENLKKFLHACDNFGLCEWQLFDPEEVKKSNNQNSISPSKDDVTQKVISTLYFLGCIVNNMSQYNGPKLDVSRLHRNTDGIIAVKKNGGMHGTSGLEHNRSSLSAMYGGGSIEDITADEPQMNGSLSNGMNGYENDSYISSQPYEFSVNVRIIGEEKRFGFSVMGGIDEGFPPRIDNIIKGSPAERANLQIGDELLEVNGVPLLNFSHMEVISSIHKCLKTRVIALKVLRGGDNVQGGFSTFYDDPTNNQEDKVDSVTQNKLNTIIKDQESDPQFPAYNSDVETNSVNSDAYLESPSNMRHNWSNGNLKLNNNDFENSDSQSNLMKHKSWSNAVLDLRQLDEIDSSDQGVLSQQNEAFDTDSNASTPVPYEPQPVSPMVNVHTVESAPSPKTDRISPNSLETLKPKLNGRNEQEKIVYLEEYLASKDVQSATKIYNTITELKHQKKGPGFSRPVTTRSHDLITQVSTSLSNSSRTQDERELEDLIYSPNFQSLLFAHDRMAFREALPDEDDVYDRETEDEDQQHSLDDQISQVEDDTVKIVRIDKSSDPLGATVKNEDGSVVIGRIVKGGAAEKSGLLHEGDEILEINGVNMKGRSVAQVCELLEDMNGTLTFLVIPNNRVIGSLSRQQHAVHVKAHFDYDPEHDELIPCRELGLAFRKGCILHIVNQDDPNWWQAWRAGDEGKKLAGLIPSKTFQQQRESLKHTLPTEKEPTSKDNRKCLCMKKKRRKKVLYNAKQNDDLEDQTLTYEEVALLQPSASRKRPIVLVGPEKIGRKELRKRLLQFDPDRFVPAVAHTSKPKETDEVNGRDYYFVTRRTFESDIVANKYVEHGEVYGHYFGISFDSIKTVINTGRICVLNCSCESFKILRASDIRPYGIFITPASFERIKGLRAGRVDPFNPSLESTLSDDGLHKLIEDARQMEDTYGHLFDYTIVNTDFERTFDEILKVIDRLEREPEWVPASWVR